ncbi:uncharacterized protein LOC110453726 isoform X1 [Mizuhopecten yessoensis]|nr:uncharacterized protein LOC110453726 isoform X1 [Mizuhopecten yessoensis]
MASHGERSSPSLESHLVKELRTVPACRTIVGYYDAVKTSNRFLEMGLTYVETGVCTVMGNMTKNLWAGSTFDRLAGDGIEKLKVRFPILEKPTKKLVKKTKHKTMKKVKNGATTMFSSHFGRMFTVGLEKAVTMTENLLVDLQPPGRISPRKQDEQKNGLKSEKTVQTEEERKVTMVSCKEQQTELSGPDMIKQKMDAMAEVAPWSRLQIVLMEVALFPLELMVEFLKAILGFLPRSTKTLPSRKSTRNVKTTVISPEKKIEIELRRKVSPKKRIQSSLLGNLKKVTCRVLGLETTSKKQSDIRDFIKCSKHRGLNLDPVVEGDESEKKRKHHDMSDESESTDEDLMYMDLHDYQSDEDPDYEPTDSSISDVSIESEEGDSEGDLETEKMNNEMYQLKDKPESKQGQLSQKQDPKGQADSKAPKQDPKGPADPKAAKQDDKAPHKQDPKIQASPKADQKSQALIKQDQKTQKSPSKDPKTPTGGPSVEDKNKNVCKQLQHQKGTTINSPPIPKK